VINLVEMKLTVIDKILIAIYLIIVVTMLLNPPWAFFHHESGRFIESYGDIFVFDDKPEGAQIHFSLLLYQIFVLGFLFASIAIAIRFIRKLFRTACKSTESKD